MIVCDQEGADWLPFSHKIEARDNTHGTYREVWWTNANAENRLFDPSAHSGRSQT